MSYRIMAFAFLLALVGKAVYVSCVDLIVWEWFTTPAWLVEGTPVPIEITCTEDMPCWHTVPLESE